MLGTCQCRFHVSPALLKINIDQGSPTARCLRRRGAEKGALAAGLLRPADSITRADFITPHNVATSFVFAA